MSAVTRIQRSMSDRLEGQAIGVPVACRSSKSADLSDAQAFVQTERSTVSVPPESREPNLRRKDRLIN